MEIDALKTKIISFLKKYRYAMLVLLIGIVFMLWPSAEKNTAQVPQETVQTSNEDTSISEELAQILSSVDGAGDVRVLLTIAAGEEVLYQTDETISIASESQSTQVSTVMITNENKSQSGLIRQTNPPVYMGAIVVCQGADSPQVQLAIVDAVSKVTGLGADRISVMKMK